jgi:single-strand DNA-binding protein
MDVKTDKKMDRVSEATDLTTLAVNEVRLVGRLSRDPEMRVLPSGDQMWAFRVVVPRVPGGRTKQSVDVLDCAVWGGRVRASVASWSADDVVEVAGPLRKRFFSSSGGPASRVEVEVTSGRLVKRAVTRREETG